MKIDPCNLHKKVKFINKILKDLVIHTMYISILINLEKNKHIYLI